MIYTPVTKKAMQIAFDAHKNQVDKGKVPYVFHPFTVADKMEDELTCAAALLHDVIEDTDITADMLFEMGVPSDVLELVKTLTRGKGEDYFDYIERIRKNPHATKVKIADLMHNSNLSRLENIIEADIKRVEKYKKTIAILKAESGS